MTGPRRRHRAADYAAAALMVAVSTLVSGLTVLWAETESNTVMIFLAGVALTAARFGHGPALAAIGLSAASYDYFFVAPAFHFSKVEPHYVITLCAMAAIGLLISELTVRLQRQLRTAQLQERRTATLYRMTREFGGVTQPEELGPTAGRAAAEAFDGAAVLFLRDAQGKLALRYGAGTPLAADPQLFAAAQQAAACGELRGQGAEAEPGVAATLAPIAGRRGVLGVLVVQPREPSRFLADEERRMLQACANLVAMSLERDQSINQAHQAQMQVETEQLRNSLLTSISHDLRTPLATIAVTAAELLESPPEQTLADRREVLETIVDETRQLGRQVDNLLDMGRINAGGATVKGEWHVLDELVGVALARLRRELASHEVTIDIPSDFPLIWAASDLMGQVLVNLLENAARYTPAGSRIEIRARRPNLQAEVVIADNGPGLPPGSEATVFNQFVRGSTKVADGRRGLGLGLAICRSIVRAHGGEIFARNRPEGGAEFVMLLDCQPLKLAQAANEGERDWTAVADAGDGRSPGRPETYQPHGDHASEAERGELGGSAASAGAAG